MYDIIIVGGGTAGLSAAIYGVRAGKEVLILEKKTYGGQIINSPEVENYPGILRISGFEFATGLYEQATTLGAKFEIGHVVEIEDEKEYKRVITEEKVYETKTIILATGAKNRPLGVEREEKFIGAGVSYCATCDGMFFRDRKVAVVGGGNTALEDALFLSNYCKQIFVIHRRKEFRGEDKLFETLKTKENVTFVLDSVVTELKGDDMLEGIIVKNVLTGEEKELQTEGLFVAIGQMPENELFINFVTLDDKGYIEAAEDCKTRTPGIFTAGDCP